MLDAPVVRQLDITLERNSPVPLYYQLAQYIEHAINAGELAPGDRIENELSLTSRLGLSRPTARQAIQELVNKGLLVRKRGVGTQVVRSQFRRAEKLSSLNEDLAKAGKVPGTVLIDYTVGPLDDEIADVVDADDVRERGLYACLNSLGVHLKIAHQQISARLMTDEEAGLLHERTPAACLSVDRLAYDDVGRFVEFGRHIYRPDYYSIQSSLQV